MKNAIKVSGLLGLFLAACGGGGSNCRIQCDNVRNTCTERCTDDTCRTTCSQELDQCRVSCDNPPAARDHLTGHTADTGATMH